MQEITPKQLWQSPNTKLTSHLREIGYYDEETDNYYVIAQFRTEPSLDFLNKRYLEIKAESKSHSRKIQKIITDIASFWNGCYDRTPTHFKMKFLHKCKSLLQELGEKTEIKLIPGEHEQPGVNQYRLDLRRGIMSLYPQSIKAKFNQLIELTPQRISSGESAATEQFNQTFREIFGIENYHNMNIGMTQTLSGLLNAAVMGAFSSSLPTLDEAPFDVVKKHAKHFEDFALLQYIKCQKIFEYNVSNNERITISFRSEEELRVHGVTLISATLHYKATEKGFLLKKIVTNASDVFLMPHVSLSKVLDILILHTQHLIKSSNKDLNELLAIFKFLSQIFRNPPRNSFETNLQMHAKKIITAKEALDLLTEISKNQSKQAMTWLKNLEDSVLPLRRKKPKFPLILDLSSNKNYDMHFNSFFSGDLSLTTLPNTEFFWDTSSSAEKNYRRQLSSVALNLEKHVPENKETVNTQVALYNKKIFFNRFWLTLKDNHNPSVSRIECSSLTNFLEIIKGRISQNTFDLFSRLNVLELAIKSKMLIFFTPLLNSLKNNKAAFEITIAKKKGGLTIEFNNSKPRHLIFCFSVFLLMNKEKVLTLDEIELGINLTQDNNFATKFFVSAENFEPYRANALTNNRIISIVNKLNAQIDVEKKGESKSEKMTSEQIFLQVNLLAPQSEQLSALATDSERLNKILEMHPAFINKRDENDQTILHHAVTLATRSGQFDKNIFSILFRQQALDFNAQDCNGRTPLHIAFLHANSKKIFLSAVSILLIEADKRQAKLELCDKQGRSIYHYAALATFNIGTFSLIGQINTHITKPNWNHLSESGATPFYYALTEYSKNLDNVNALLSSGANPLLYGSVERNPIVLIKQKFELLVIQSSVAVSKNAKENLIKDHESLVKLVSLIEEHVGISGINEATVRELTFPTVKVSGIESRFDFASAPLEMKGSRSSTRVVEVLTLPDIDKPAPAAPRSTYSNGGIG